MTVAPALLQRSLGSRDLLGGSARGATRGSSATGETLLILQIALTVVLLVGAGLFTRSMRRVSDLDLGFGSRPVIGVRATLTAIADTSARRPTLAKSADALRELPGVEEVAVSISAPFRPSFRPRLFIPGRDDLPGVGPNGLGYPTLVPVSPEYFSVMAIPVLRGRRFTAADNATAAPVMMIDATMARTFWPDGDALGRCLRVGRDTMPCTTIVGVVGDVRAAVAERQHALRYFIPIDQATFGRNADRYLFARTSRDAAQMLAGVRAAVAAAAPTTPFSDVFEISPWLDPQTRRWRLGMNTFVAFGALATVIATIGLYGVVSFGVARRERELGIRRALGAATSSLLRSVIVGASVRSLVGILIGGVLSVELTRRVWELLFQPSRADAIVFGAAFGIVLGATVMASAGPAWRAMRADPMRALRSE
jgi:predicted permease